MVKKLGKKARLLIVMISILSLMGCGSLNKIQANQIEEKLSEMYGGEFEVLALGNRFGTLTNDTVTARVKSKDLDMLFDVKMNTKGRIVADNFLARHIGIQVSNVLTKNIKDQGIEAKSYLAVLGGKDVKTLKINTSVPDYIKNYSPEYFAGFLILKEGTNYSGIKMVEAFQQTYQDYLSTTFHANVYIIAEEDYERCIRDLDNETVVYSDLFEEYIVISKFKLSVTSEGISKNENEVNNLLQGGK
ncbi:hypothetical protein [Caldifermentibacillus hisashii]|jgi:hypothetical protein|uniref:hypothetical protein n=1 Tax=Caldifermentibacillus hisashii TaxID=996558 RepID=UPI0022B9CD0B|nr:hypothetical protein [Caldifermentibacillus hisashii]